MGLGLGLGLGLVFALGLGLRSLDYQVQIEAKGFTTKTSPQDREKRMGLDGDPPSMEMIWQGDPSDR